MKVIGFYKNRWIFFSISLAILLFVAVMSVVNGVAFDINFTGGSILKYTYEGEINEKEAAGIAADIIKRDVTTQITTDLKTGDKRLVLNIAGNQGLDAKLQGDLFEALEEAYPDANLTLDENWMVDPFVSKQFLRDGITAIVIALIGVVIYVWIRFRKIGGLSAGIMALAALFYDLFIVFATCVIFKVPIGDITVAVALSIIGYSINDTIVIYDRIRENAKLYPKLPVETVTDLSITQSMTRSINTNLAVIICVGLVAIFASIYSLDSIRDFALPMAIGSISGCYTSICLSGPLWVAWKKKRNETTFQ